MTEVPAARCGQRDVSKHCCRFKGLLEEETCREGGFFGLLPTVGDSKMHKVLTLFYQFNMIELDQMIQLTKNLVRYISTSQSLNLLPSVSILMLFSVILTCGGIINGLRLFILSPDISLTKMFINCNHISII